MESSTTLLIESYDYLPPPADCIQEFQDSALITWFDGAAEFFESNKIYLQYPWKVAGVYRPGDKIRIHKGALAEAYTSHPQNRVISLGAFSYCRTPQVAPDFKAGRYCSIASGVSLSDLEHPLDRITTHPFTTHPHMTELARREFGKSPSITPHSFLRPAPQIGHDVWIGEGALIKRGITIGNGAVIGARALVTKDVPDYAVVGGSPARVLKFRFDEETRGRLLELEWWKYNYADFPAVDPTDIGAFIAGLEKGIQAGDVIEFKPPMIKILPAFKAFVGIE